MRLETTSGRSAGGFRFLCSFLACFVGALGVWLLATEFLRPARIVSFDDPGSRISPVGAASAASVGLVRGDLWGDAAMAQAVPLLTMASGGANPPISSASLEDALGSARRAVAYAPLDARAWLVLALLGGSDAARAAAYLKMSYYASPSLPVLIPTRIKAFASIAPVADDELRDLFRYDVQTVLTLRPALRPALVAAYAAATPAGRRQLEDIVGPIDRPFLATLMTQAPTGLNPGVSR